MVRPKRSHQGGVRKARPSPGTIPGVLLPTVVTAVPCKIQAQGSTVRLEGSVKNCKV